MKSLSYYKNKIFRNCRYFWQRRKRGFDDSELYSLDVSIAKYILPRLKRFKEITVSHPYNLTPEEWDEILQKMIDAFEIISSDKYFDVDFNKYEKNSNITEEGFKLFDKYFSDLWI